VVFIILAILIWVCPLFHNQGPIAIMAVGRPVPTAERKAVERTFTAFLLFIK